MARACAHGAIHHDAARKQKACARRGREHVAQLRTHGVCAACVECMRLERFAVRRKGGVKAEGVCLRRREGLCYKGAEERNNVATATAATATAASATPAAAAAREGCTCKCGGGEDK